MISSRKYLACLTPLLLLVFTKCDINKNLVSDNEHSYKKNNYNLDARFIVYHLNDSISQLFFSLPNENLNYKRTDTSSWFYTQVKIKYEIPDKEKSRHIKDSGSVWIRDRQPENANFVTISGSLNMKIKSGQVIPVNILVYDVNKKTTNTKIIEVDKSNENTRQNFLLQASNGQIIYDYYLHPGDEVYIKSQRNQLPQLKVDYFKGDFPLSPPPFSLVERVPFQYKPDSSFIAVKIGYGYKIFMPDKGFYHLVTGEQNKEGLTLFSVEEAFPGIKNEIEMIKSSRYIMNMKEYGNCLNAVNRKEAIDEFWKDIGGSNERARELLKKYYSRVSEANKLFTSYQPGWKSDRGMIYIVFGAPLTMYKTDNGEQWIYGNESQANSIRFNFKKVINPFSDNDFSLERSEYYKQPWHIAVTYWREGHIYLDN